MKKSIMIMDDDIDIRTTIVDILEDQGYSVFSAGDGFEGLNLLNSMETLPGLIILDLMMPNLNGDQFLQQRSARLTEVPVAFFSADSDIQNRSAAAGIEFVRKPVNFQQFLSIVSRHCD